MPIKIQASKQITPIELEKGFEGQFESSMSNLIGIQLISLNLNAPQYDKTVRFEIENENILPSESPFVLFQSSFEVNPNQRFFGLNKKNISGKRFRIFSSGHTANVIVVFLLNDEKFNTINEKIS